MVTNLTVVVIFNHPCRLLLRPLQQCHAPRQAKRNPQWTLVGRRQHRHPSLRRPGHTAGNVHALFINRHRHRPHAGGLKQRQRHRIARILQPYLIVRLEQGTDHQIQQRLIPCADKHLFRSATDAARKL
ncbi:hypothetical protein D3C78_1319000 [compost metagenome]